jgi:hypothetical protein
MWISSHDKQRLAVSPEVRLVPKAMQQRNRRKCTSATIEVRVGMLMHVVLFGFSIELA